MSNRLPAPGDRNGGRRFRTQTIPGVRRDATHARALRGEDAIVELGELIQRLGAPRALRDLGMPEAGIETAVGAALRNPYRNPRPLEA